MSATHSFVRVFGQILKQLQELRGLADEQSVCRKRVDSSHSRPGRFCGTNDRTRGELPTEERCGLGHDQVRLEIFATQWRGVQIRKRHRHSRHGIDHIRNGKEIAGFVLPCLEMADFGSPDAEEDPENLHISRSLRKHWVQAGSTLLDPGEVKAGRVAHRLDKAAIRRIGVSPGNRGVLTYCQRWDRVAEFVAEIGIPFAAAIAGPEISVNAELRQVGEASEGLI